MSYLHTLLRIAEVFFQREISVKKRPRIQTVRHPRAVQASDMGLYADLILEKKLPAPRNIFEIGANFGQDAEYLRSFFKLAPSDVFAFEAHPQICPEIKKLYGFHCFDFAVSNTDGQATFNMADLDCIGWNSGMSSLRDPVTGDNRNYRRVDVIVRRMDSFIKDYNIQSIDFLKIDVEGVNYEVLEGFGAEITKVKYIQIEAEHKICWEGQKLYSDIESHLKTHGFVLLHFALAGSFVQSDSFWVRADLLH